MKMVSKIVHFAIIVGCVSQLANAALPSRSRQNLISSGIRRHKLAIQNVQRAADNAVRTVHTITHTLVLQANEAVAKSRAQIAEIETSVRKEVTALGGNLASCAADQQDAIDELVRRVAEDVFACVTEQVNETGALVIDVNHLASQSIQLVRNSVANVSVCLGHPFSAATCIREVVEGTEVDVEMIADALERITEKAQAILSGAAGQISACADEKLAAAGPEVQQVVVEIAQCIVDGSISTTEDSSELITEN